MATFDEYRDACGCARLVRDEGVLEVALHTDGGPFVFSEPAHRELGALFHTIGADALNRVVILTGTGDSFCAAFDYASFADRRAAEGGEEFWMRLRRDGTRMLSSFLDIEVPVIAAVNGPALSHSELPLLADVVLSSDTASFQDATHFIAGIPPGDGMHIVWTALLGPNRGRYFLLTGERIDAASALRLGVVGEVLAPANLLPRAWDLARSWAALPRLTLLGTRAVVTQEWRRRFAAELHTGLTHEALADVNRVPGHASEPIVDLLAARRP